MSTFGGDEQKKKTRVEESNPLRSSNSKFVKEAVMEATAASVIFNPRIRESIRKYLILRLREE